MIAVAGESPGTEPVAAAPRIGPPDGYLPIARHLALADVFQIVITETNAGSLWKAGLQARRAAAGFSGGL